MITTQTDIQKKKARLAAGEYYKAKKNKPSKAVLGFIIKNNIIGKTVKEIDALIESAKKLSGGAIMGEGDKFRAWCKKQGRNLPGDDLVMLMNADPFDAGIEVRKMIPIHPKLWRAYCTYLAGSGR